MRNDMKINGIAGVLRELGFSPWHMGYLMLCEAIPRYRENRSQSITKELYPALARRFGNYSGCTAERTIRYAVAEAWNHGNRAVWESYFPGGTKPPSNLRFIATVADTIP